MAFDPTLVHRKEDYQQYQIPSYVLDQVQMGIGEGIASPAILADIPHMLRTQSFDMPYFEALSGKVASGIGYEGLGVPYEGTRRGDQISRGALASRIGAGMFSPGTYLAPTVKVARAIPRISRLPSGAVNKSRREFLENAGMMGAGIALGTGGLKLAKKASTPAKTAKMSVREARHKWWDNMFGAKDKERLQTALFDDVDRMLDPNYSAIEKLPNSLLDEAEKLFYHADELTPAQYDDIIHKILREHPDDVLETAIRTRQDKIGALTDQYRNLARQFSRKSGNGRPVQKGDLLFARQEAKAQAKWLSDELRYLEKLKDSRNAYVKQFTGE